MEDASHLINLFTIYNNPRVNATLEVVLVKYTNRKNSISQFPTSFESVEQKPLYFTLIYSKQSTNENNRPSEESKGCIGTTVTLPFLIILFSL